MPRQETDEQGIARIAGAHELGLAFFKTLVLLNSGAFVVLMTYMGSAQSAAAFKFPLSAITCSMTAFLIGIVAIMGALITSYVYTALNYASKLKMRLDTSIIPVNTILAVISLASFCTGVFVLIQGASVSP